MHDTTPAPGTPDEPSGVPFEEFYADYFPRLVAAAKAITGNEHTAQDAAQYACTEASKRWERITHPKAYTRKVMVQYLRDYERLLDRFRPIPHYDVVLPGDCPVDERMKVLDILAALGGLPLKERRVMVLVGMCEMTGPEAAEALGESLGSVHTAASRARKKLRASLGFGTGQVSSGDGFLTPLGDPLFIALHDAAVWLARGIREAGDEGGAAGAGRGGGGRR
ncbi:RNA polymerase sigma factor [Streptomyces yangpuensis]|uniref:RNA polymerase sigma factor n=1 Tax=Streptomyces yangpuensis TaxID=1648182 RepID=UPI000629D128|nr:sigma-70 family RNA polymerase sigma factor [Streptomyces yangpuensis]